MLSCLSSVFIVLLASALAFAVPIPIGPGDVAVVKPKFFEPKPPGTNKTGSHPVVVLSTANASNKVQVAVITHNHPGNPPTKPPSDYGLPQSGSIDVGPPKFVDASKLKDGNQKMSPENFAKLKSDINENCGDGQKLTWREGTACKMRPKPAARGVTNKKAPAAPKARAKKA